MALLLILHIVKGVTSFFRKKNLLLPVVKDKVKTMFGNKFLKKIDLIPLSNDKVSCRINNVPSNVECQLTEKVKSFLCNTELKNDTGFK